MTKEVKTLHDLELPFGYGKQIARKLNCTIDKVYDVKGGLIKDRDIAIEILKVAAEQRNKKRRQQEELDKVLKLFPNEEFDI